MLVSVFALILSASAAFALPANSTATLQRNCGSHLTLQQTIKAELAFKNDMQALGITAESIGSMGQFLTFQALG
jgi:hypothetical protein